MNDSELVAEINNRSYRLSMAEERVAILENAIRTHRAQKADDRCIEDDDKLYEAMGDGIKCDRRVGDKTEMLKNCMRFIDQRCDHGHWPSYATLESALQRIAQSVCYCPYPYTATCSSCVAREALNTGEKTNDPTPHTKDR